MTKHMFLGAALALTLTTAAAQAETAVASATSASGTILVDGAGMSLYIFDNDQPGTSNCYDACAQNWPPLATADGAMAEGDFAIIDRSDGTQQWTYKGMPLYTWINDKAPGDITGDGVKGVWHLARP